jgi:hypothetical protein
MKLKLLDNINKLIKLNEKQTKVRKTNRTNIICLVYLQAFMFRGGNWVLLFEI